MRHLLLTEVIWPFFVRGSIACALVALAILLASCGRETPPEPIPAVPTQLVCPAPARPPAELLVRPETKIFAPPET